jgi:MinD-like ATPase involved in chromosome partitioning or flagellar assembly
MPLHICAGTGLPGLQAYLETLESVQVVRSSENLDDLLRTLDLNQPDLILLSRFLPGIGPDLVQTLSQVRSAGPSAEILLFVGPDSADLRSVKEVAERLRIKLVVGDLTDRVIKEAIPSGSSRTAHVVAFYGAKGGVGTSLLAANFAVIAAGKGLRVAAVDLNLVNPNLHIHLANTGERGPVPIEALRTLQQLVPVLAQPGVTHADVQAFLSHTTAGVQLLAGPVFHPKESGQIRYEPLELLVELLSTSGAFDLIVLDTASHLASDGTYAALLAADTICLVTTSLLCSLHDQLRQIRVIEALGIARSKCLLTVNQHMPELGLSDEAAQALDVQLISSVPFDPITAARSVNRGRPLSLDRPKHPIATALHPLFAHLFGARREAHHG